MAELSKFGSHTNIKIPPESTGSRIHHRIHHAIEVSGPLPLQSPLPWTFENTTGATGFVVSFGNLESSLNKRIDVILGDESEITALNIGDSLTITDSLANASICSVVAFELINTPAVVLNSGRAPSNFLNIDKAGSAFVRFTEGEQQLDPKGITRITTPTTLMDVKFTESTNSSLVFAKIENDATETFINTERLLALDVGTGTSDSIKKRTDKHAFFQGGFGSIYETTVAVGDNGKANVTRRWGYYSDTDGLFFELEGTSLCVVIRSSTSGTVVDTKIPQSQWNVDRLDGTGTTTNLSGINLDVSFMNYYVIDFPGSTAGKVRFGILGPNGRLVAHEIYFGNNLTTNFMRTALLPMTWEQFNTGVSASPSRMKTLGGTVMNEGFAIPESQIAIANNFTYVTQAPVTTTGSDFVHLVTARSGKFKFGSGDTIVNTKSTIPKKFAYHIVGGPILLQVRVGVIFDGVPNFQNAAFGSPTEIDVAGIFPTNPLSQGLPIITRMHAAGQHVLDPPDIFNVRGQTLTIRSDGEFGLAYSFVFKPLNPTDTVSFQIGFDWIDV